MATTRVIPKGNAELPDYNALVAGTVGIQAASRPVEARGVYLDEFRRQVNETTITAGISKLFVTFPSFYMTGNDMQKHIDGAIMDRNPELRNPGGVSLSGERLMKAGHIEDTLGCKEMRFPGYSEGNVTMAADVLYGFVNSIVSSKEDFASFCDNKVEKIFFGTESNPDKSRPEVEPALQMVISKLRTDQDEARRFDTDASGNLGKYAEARIGRIERVISVLKDTEIVPVTYACVGGVNALGSAVDSVRSAAASGRRSSALVITVDTATYEDAKARNAEATQGAAATLSWITTKPELLEIVDIRSGNHHAAMSDFTKFGNDTPFVWGRVSELTYIHMVGKAFKNLVNYNGGDEAFDAIVMHTPFPRQPIYASTFLFAHKLRRLHPEVLAEVESRIGSDPLRETGFTVYVDNVFEKFNKEGEPKSERELYTMLEKDPNIRSYLKWLEALKGTDQFRQFVNDYGIDLALGLPSRTGNSYSSATFVSTASLLQNVGELANRQASVTARFGHEEHDGIRLLFIGYGSGAHATAKFANIVATPASIEGNVVCLQQNGTQIDVDTYRTLHASHLQGDAKRFMVGEDINLVNEDLKLCARLTGRQMLAEGFKVVRRYEDGTGRYAYSHRDGSITDLGIRF